MSPRARPLRLPGLAVLKKRKISSNIAQRFLNEKGCAGLSALVAAISLQTQLLSRFTMKKTMLAALTAVLACAAPLAPAASDYLLELDGIKGESGDDIHKDAIQIESFSWGASNPTASAGSGGGAGKVQFQDLHFTTKVSKASPQLLLACAAGRPIPQATLLVRKSGDTQVYLRYKLENVIISSYSVSGNSASATPGTVTAGSVPDDMIKISFTRIEMSYIADDGTVTSGSAELTITPQ
jgi:type VI secretion system secreted protein Hcp